MFKIVYNKLERAEYCLDNLKAFEKEARGLPYVPSDKQQQMRANLDCFLFEIMSAKDLFLQSIYVNYKVRDMKNERNVTKPEELVKYLEGEPKDVVESVRNLLDGGRLEKQQKLEDDQDSWLWRLNNFRNAATHRKLLGLGIVAEVYSTIKDKKQFEKIKRGEVAIKLMFEEEEKNISPKIPMLKIPRENVKTYLNKDPYDAEKGNMDLEVIPYCEQSLDRMKRFLKKLYSELGAGTNSH